MCLYIYLPGDATIVIIYNRYVIGTKNDLIYDKRTYPDVFRMLIKIN